MAARAMTNNGHNPLLDQVAAAAQQAPTPEQGIPISPVPTMFQVVAGQFNGTDFVILIVTTGLGPQHYFLPPEIAKTVGTALHQAGTAAASGLTIIGSPGGLPETP